MDLPIFDVKETAQRRRALAARVRAESPDGSGLVIIPAKAESAAAYAAHRYRPDSYLLYFSGLREPEATLIIDVMPDREESIIVLRPKDEAVELWEGTRLGVEAARDTLWMDGAFATAQLMDVLGERLQRHRRIYHASGRVTTLDAMLQTLIDMQRNKVRQGIAPIQAVYDFRLHADDMRLIKSPWEIARMRYACQASAEAMTGAMARVNAGVGEHEVMGYLIGEYYRRNLSAPSYTPIVGSHQNACILHYTDNNQIMPEAAVTLMDAAGEYYGYCADITRVAPTGKTFTPEQKIIYQLVHQAHDAALAQARAGLGFNDYHEAAVRVICEGLIALGWIKGDLETAIKEERYKPYFMHRTGHFLGLDTHDVGAYRQGDQWRELAAGMILTIEPGIYIRPAEHIPKAFHHLGIRLENDILITNGAPENLSQAAPINLDEVEQLKV